MLQLGLKSGYININCVDPLGRGALSIAIDGESLEMVELLIVMAVETKDALLHSIDVGFVEAAELLLEHEELIHKEGEPYVSLFLCVTCINQKCSNKFVFIQNIRFLNLP
jgi:transient-receptor-potential-like protein